MTQFILFRRGNLRYGLPNLRQIKKWVIAKPVTTAIFISNPSPPGTLESLILPVRTIKD